TAEQMVEAVEAGGYVATGISTAATRSIPSIAMPRVTTSRGEGAEEKPRSTVGGLAIFVLVLLLVGGAGSFFGIRQGLMSRLSSKAVPMTPVDTSAALQHDSTVPAAGDTTRHDTSHALP